MKKNNPARPIFLGMTLLFGLLPTGSLIAATEYHEQGKKGIPDSWLSDEFKNQWGLASIGAHYAYARGYTGKGINVGVLDEAVTNHPEFADKLKIIAPSDIWNYSYDPYSDLISFGAHGNHVSGTIAANRDGKEMHGVAFDAGLVTAKFLQNDYNRTEAMIQSDARIINNSWGVRPRYYVGSDGRPIRLPNGTIAYYKVTLKQLINYVSPIKEKLNELSQAPLAVTGEPLASDAGMLRAARQGKLMVFAAGNANNYNVTWLHAGMPYFFPDVLKNYLSVTNLKEDGLIAPSSTSCGYTASWCLAAPGTKVYSSTGDFVSKNGGEINEDALKKGELEIDPTYDTYTGTSMAAPHVAGAAAVLMQRFPYMTTAQIADVIKTTATDLGTPGLDDLYGWGKLNLKDAINGPKMFITKQDIPAKYYIEGSYTETQFIANIDGIGSLIEPGTTVQRVCNSIECVYDYWSNDISGHGGLTKTGSGALLLTGASTYSGTTWVNQGLLLVNGSITSDVTVQSDATLSGKGTVGSLTAYNGANIAPGNTDAALNVDREVIFETGSRYQVTLTPDGKSDRILSNGMAGLEGGEVQVTLENRGNLLSQQKVRSLLGQQYNILQASNGIYGQFDTVSQGHLFLDIPLNYQFDRALLDIKRNTTEFASLATTANGRSVAKAADMLNSDHPVHESILMVNSAAQASQAFSQLSGQVHADIAAAQINSSRYLRDTLNTRLRQANGVATSQEIKADTDGAWVQIMGNWQRASGNNEVSGYRMSNYGVLLGVDKCLSSDWRLGVATGYTRSSLHGGDSASARSDNYHLALYGSKQIDALALRAGVAYSWHRFDTERSVAFGDQSDDLKAKYGARTGQLFTEAGYGIKTSWLNLEPFANLAHVNFHNNSINEQGGAAALHGDKKSQNATFSTLGLRADQKWKIERESQRELHVGVYGELGWQHRFGNINRGTKLGFSNSNTMFTVNSVSAGRDAAVVKAGTELDIGKNTTLALGYNGVLSGSHKDNGVFLNANWRF
ncbi:autotransporter domain-containing protein [Xenorhabdus bovienii]|uniref:Putative Extracellular serine protease n=1 Tax=Xenorhabdus bovienii str. kraussei Becker Underwood TaxID=1398204 RepID=A0A077Q331_XENBV|nr:autotransporter serine protease [Xenorhabdus bovienii]CDH26469.1 putative Extracellular serine protease precursor [Xenorhabdus bovienii str. kraussei Becker Underwood]